MQVSEKAVLLRNVLYDAVMLVDYSFLHSDRWLRLNGNHLNGLALVWVLVADAAVRFATYGIVFLADTHC